MARTMTCRRCDATLNAEDDEQLIAAMKEHYRREHRFLSITDDEFRAKITEDARDA